VAAQTHGEITSFSQAFSKCTGGVQTTQAAAQVHGTDAFTLPCIPLTNKGGRSLGSKPSVWL
jgi:hypothetical protein